MASTFFRAFRQFLPLSLVLIRTLRKNDWPNSCLAQYRMEQRIVGLAGAVVLGFAGVARPASPDPLPPILDYIKRTWIVLTRSDRNLATAAVDPKQHPSANGRWPVYISGKENLDSVTQELRGAMTPADFEKIEIRTLPADLTRITEHGLLYSVSYTHLDVYKRQRLSMPQNDPGKLSRQQNADILAYMLLMNRFPEGKAELDKDSAVLKQIRLDAEKEKK